MHAIKRWSIGLFSKVDEVVAKVENHEALMDAAIGDLRKEVTAAKVQFNRVKRDGIQLKKNAEEAGKNARLWRSRATASMDSEETALECLRRAKKEAAREMDLLSRCTQHLEVEKKLTATVNALENRMSVLQEKRNVLKTRQTSATALKIAGDGMGEFGGDASEILSRWESKIEGMEYGSEGVVDSADVFESQFEEAEVRSALLAELEELRRDNND